MTKTYIKPAMKVAAIDAEQLLCESNVMGYSDDEFASHDPQGDEVLVKGSSSIWDVDW